MGLNEAAGYGAVAVTALVTGYLAQAYGLRPAPFLLAAAYIVMALALSILSVKRHASTPMPRPQTSTRQRPANAEH